MKKSLASIFLLITYSLLLVKVMVLKDIPLIRIGSLMLNFGGTDSGHGANFLPFKTILPYLLGYKGLVIAGINLGGNIVLLVPLGFLIALVFRGITWKKALALAVASGLVIELMQVVLRVGIFDIDDVILNALGVMIGYWAFVILAKWMSSKNYKNIIIALIIVIAAMAAASYVIYPKGQPVNPMVGAQNIESIDEEGGVPQGGDLCGGTGGTGEIVSLGNHAITIQRNDGVNQTLILTEQTTIKTSAGPASESDLKIGDRVTVVVNDTETASVVLVCSIPPTRTQSGE